MMCIYSTTNSARYTEEENVDPGSEIITSVGLPQTPPDSDPGSSPSGISNEDNDGKECVDNTLGEQLDIVNDMKDNELVPRPDNRISSIGSSVLEKKSITPKFSERQDEMPGTINSFHLQFTSFKDAGGDKSINNEYSPSLNVSKINVATTNQCVVAHQKSKVVSVELPPTPPTMVDEIHNQKKRRRNSKFSKRKLRLSDPNQKQDVEAPPKYRDYKVFKTTEESRAEKKCLKDPLENDSEGLANDATKEEELGSSDMSSEEEEREMEKVLDVNPINRYKRVLVKNGEGGWLLQFVSPCGQYRFNSEKELALNLGQNVDQEEDKPYLKAKKSPTDPFAQKLTILRKRLANGLSHFLRQSLDECAIRAQRTQIHSSNQFNSNGPNEDLHESNTLNEDGTVNKESRDTKETKTAPFTFVNMRQNIFDMTASKRKRIQASCGKQSKYRKYNSAKDWNRRNSIAAINVSTSKTNIGKDDLIEDLISPKVSYKDLENQEKKNINRGKTLHHQSASSQISTIKSQDYQLCESIITSIIYSCVDQQSSVENRLHCPSQIVETNLANKKCKFASPNFSTKESDEISSSSNIGHSSPKTSAFNKNNHDISIKTISKTSQQDHLQQNDLIDICNR